MATPDPNDKQTRLLLAVLAKVETVDLLKSVVLGRLEHFNHERPAAGIIPVIDEEKRASKTHNVSDLDILIRLLADEDDDKAGIELSMAVYDVKQAMKNGGDRTWGGLCNDFFPGAVKWLYVDAQLPRAGADLEYRFHYQLEP